MKTGMRVTIAALALAGVATVARAAEPDALRATMTAEKLARIESSLAHALTMPCCGIQTTAARTVRDLKVLVPEAGLEGTIIPLMRIVKDENLPSASRVMAALALHELRDGRGDYAVAGMARFAADEKVQRACKWLVWERAVEGKEGSLQEVTMEVPALAREGM